ncbi:hypothetical protein OIE66_17415 [Nonomuraea sp. NBC_01738]|uniref:hypothetical protein n=1 Tax=Nonomuraea sp. NBC_01738 TaxID=2976003 RepID=UPI002E15E627|nr:hypothetical protein OIE66_17415 [Nonomuraea sp. NBC_01738]
MATVMITDGLITIEFGLWERLFLGRSRHTIPLYAVRQAVVTERPLRLARGARKGLTVSGYTKIGIWGVLGGPRQLVAAYRNQPGAHLVLDRASSGGDFDEVLVSLPDPDRLVEAIRRVAA